MALAILTVRSLRQRHGLLKRVVGARPPDLPRLPFWRALWQPRPPLVAERLAVPILRLAVVLLVLLLAGGNTLALFAIAATEGQRANLAEIHPLTFWLALLLFNLIVVAVIAALGVEARRLRTRRHKA